MSLLDRWVANTKRVLAKDKNTGSEYEFESIFPDGAPDGTAFNSENMNKIIDAVNGLDESKGQPNGIATLNGNGKLAQMPTAADVGAVPTSRTVNGKSLNGNISLTAANVGAIPLIEESTWTPNVLEMRGLSGGCTYTSREGHFIRIGKMVVATFDIVVAKKPTTANWTNYTQVCVNWLPGNYVRTDRAYNMGARVTLKSGTDPIVASTQFAYNTVAFTVADGPLLTNMLGDGFVLNGSIAYIVNV